MAYTGHAGYSENDAPTFSIVGENDYIADPEVMRRRAQKMNGLGIPVAFKVVAGLGHGFGIGTGTNAEGWIEEAVRLGKTTEIGHVHVQRGECESTKTEIRISGFLFFI